jgi:hypothetical protein
MDTQSRPLHNAPAGTGVHPDLTEADGLTVHFVPSPATDGVGPSSPIQRASDSDSPPQADVAAEPRCSGGERSDG